MPKSIKRNFLYNILLNVSKVIFPLITAPYVSRVLEPDGVGLFNFANTYAGYFALFAALGIPYYGIREVAKINDNQKEQTKFVSEIISISVLATVISSILMLLSLVLVPQLNENYVIFLMAGIILYTTPFKIDWYFQGREEFGYITFRSLVIKTLSVILLFVLVREKSDLLIYVALNAAALVLNELWNFAKLYQSGIHPYFTLSGTRHLRPLLILFSSAIAIHIYVYIDTVMLGFMTNYDEVGFYNCATHITKAILPVVTSLSAVAIPRMSILGENHSWDDINRLMNKSFSIVGFLCFPIAIGVIIISPIFIPLFYGYLYEGTIVPLQIIALTIILIGFNNITGMQILLGLGMDRCYMRSVVVGTIVNLLLNVILIPFYGAIGASIASVVAELVVLVAMSYYVYRETLVRVSIFKELFLDAAFAGSFFLISMITVRIFGGWWYVGITVAICSVFYVLIQYIVGNPSEKTIEKVIIKTK